MQASQLARAYKTNAISTVGPGAIVLMLMDAALVAIMSSLEGFSLEGPVERNERIHNNVGKAEQILAVLQAALDLDVDSEFPGQMYALYGFMMEELKKGNYQKAEEPIHVVRGMLQDIRDAWAEMLLQEMAAS